MSQADGDIKNEKLNVTFRELSKISQVLEQFSASNKFHNEEYFIFSLENKLHSNQKWMISLH